MFSADKKFEQMRKEILEEGLAYFNGNKSRLAASLGLSIRTIRNWCREFEDTVEIPALGDGRVVITPSTTRMDDFGEF